MARRINLIPQAERARTKTNVGVLGLVVAAIVVVAALGLGYWTLSGQRDDREQELQIVQQERQKKEAEAASLDQYVQLASQRDQAEEVVRGIYAGRTLVSKVLDDISRVLPEKVWFETLSLGTSDPTTGPVDPANPPTGNAVSISGSTFSFEEVAELLVRLQLIPSLSGISLGSASGEQAEGSTSKSIKTFSIGAAVSNTQPADTALPMSQVEVEGP